MFAIERKCEFRMIDLGRFPCFRGVAGGAIGAKRACMEIIFLMAGVTIL